MNKELIKQMIQNHFDLQEGKQIELEYDTFIICLKNKQYHNIIYKQFFLYREGNCFIIEYLKMPYEYEEDAHWSIFKNKNEFTTYYFTTNKGITKTYAHGTLGAIRRIREHDLDWKKGDYIIEIKTLEELRNQKIKNEISKNKKEI